MNYALKVKTLLTLATLLVIAGAVFALTPKAFGEEYPISFRAQIDHINLNHTTGKLTFKFGPFRGQTYNFQQLGLAKLGIEEGDYVRARLVTLNNGKKKAIALRPINASYITKINKNGNGGMLYDRMQRKEIRFYQPHGKLLGLDVDVPVSFRRVLLNDGVHVALSVLPQPFTEGFGNEFDEEAGVEEVEQMQGSMEEEEEETEQEQMNEPQEPAEEEQENEEPQA